MASENAGDFVGEMIRVAVPVTPALRQAMIGNWSERNEPLIDELKAADVVLGFAADDATGKSLTVFYGREFVQETKDRGAKWDALGGRPMKYLPFIVDCKTDDRDVLVAACVVLRGRCDFRTAKNPGGLDED